MKNSPGPSRLMQIDGQSPMFGASPGPIRLTLSYGNPSFNTRDMILDILPGLEEHPNLLRKIGFQHAYLKTLGTFISFLTFVFQVIWGCSSSCNTEMRDNFFKMVSYRLSHGRAARFSLSKALHVTQRKNTNILTDLYIILVSKTTIFLMDVWWNTHFSCSHLEPSNWNNMKQPWKNGCFGYHDAIEATLSQSFAHSS